MTAPRDALARRISELAGDVPVAFAPVRNAAPPIFIVAPAIPYQRPSNDPGCSVDWYLDVWTITTREDVNALDTLDLMAAQVEAAAQAPDWPETDHLIARWVGVERANQSTEDLAGMPGLAAIVRVRVTEYE
jgi:hypothetical protein